MASDKSERVRAILDEARNAVAGGVAGAGAAAAGGGGAGLVAAGGMAGAIPGTLAMLVNVARGWKERDARKWWHDVVYDARHDGKSPEEIAGIIDAHEDAPFVRETILRSLRALLDAPDECVVTPLAMLAREYLREQRSPDFFFRGTASILGWCSRDMFEQLQRIAAAALKAFEDETVKFVRVEAGSLREVS